MNQTVRFTNFDRDFFEPCVTLFVDVFNAPPWNDQWTLERATCWLKLLTSGPDFRGYCGFSGKDIIAVVLGRKRIWWRRDQYNIEEMFVRGTAQGKGIGSHLLRFIEVELVKQGISAITLATGHEMPARNFYAKNGFCHSDASILMRKKLL